MLRRRRAGLRSELRTSRHSNMEQVRFEIRKTVFSLPSCVSKTELGQKFDYMYNWCLMEADCKDVIDNLHKIHWLLDEWQFAEVPRRVYELFWHYVGPDRVPMAAQQEKRLIEAIDLLEDLGFHAMVLTYKPKTVIEILNTLHSFQEIGSWYKRASIRKAVRNALAKIQKEGRAGLGYQSNGKIAKSNLKNALVLVEAAIKKT